MKLSHIMLSVLQDFQSTHANEFSPQGYLQDKSLPHDANPKETLLIFLTIMAVLFFSCDKSLSLSGNSNTINDSTRVLHPSTMQVKLEELQESKHEAILFFKQNQVSIYALRNLPLHISGKNRLSLNMRANELELRNNNVMLGILKFQPTTFDELHNLKIEYMQELEDVSFATRVMLVESE